MWLQGQRFGTIGCEKDGERFEITTFRAEVYHPDSRKPEVTFSDDIETDLSRRDFTVNAMAIALDEPELVDPFDGLGRPRGAPAAHAALARDLVRRRPAADAARGAVRRDARVRARRRARRRRSRRCATGSRSSSAERIRDELSKLLVADDPSPGLWFLARTRLSDEFLPELNAMRLEQDPIHRHKDVLAHTIAVVAKTSPAR